MAAKRDTFLPRKSDFDGDNKSDPVKFAATGLAWWFKSGTMAWDLRRIWAPMARETYVRRSDFDGDGRADAAKYDPGTGVIWYVSSRTGATNGVYVGADGTPMSGSDFDRDGKTDLAKYVGGPPGPGRGAIWYIKSSNGAWQGAYIGYDADTALAGSDYDGDGKTDVAKYVSNGAIWYIESSTGTWQGFYIGNDGIPISGSDFDADGKTDAAKFVPSISCLWYIESSTGTWQGVYLGEQPFDYISASDFDGDAKTDPAKFESDSSIGLVSEVHHWALGRAVDGGRRLHGRKLDLAVRRHFQAWKCCQPPNGAAGSYLLGGCAIRGGVTER